MPARPIFPPSHPTIRAREAAQPDPVVTREADTAWLEGFVSQHDDKVRLYQSLSADRYIEVSINAVLEVDEAEDPEGWVRVKLDPATLVSLRSQRAITRSAGDVEQRLHIGILAARARDDDEPPVDPRQCLFDCITASGPIGETPEEQSVREFRCIVACSRKRASGGDAWLLA